MEYLTCRYHLFLCNTVQFSVRLSQHYLRVGSNDFLALGTGLVSLRIHVRILNEQCSRGCRQFLPIPVTDRRIPLVGHIADYHFLVASERCTWCRIVSIEVRLHIHQCHSAVSTGIDGDRNLYLLAVGIWRTCIC